MTHSQANGGPILELKNVTLQFGAVTALDGVNLSVNAGEVLGLMGDNGAGKSTIVKIFGGNHAPTSGYVFVEGNAVEFRGPADARSAGIEVVYQDLALCDNLTAAENVFLGRETMYRFGRFAFAINQRSMRARAGELFRLLESDTRTSQLVSSMSGGQRQAVAIARTQLNRSKIVLLDEPTAAISVRQIEQVLKLIRRLKEQGVTVMLISHRMPDVFSVADRIVVLQRGVKVADVKKADTSPQEITGLIVGSIERL